MTAHLHTAPVEGCHRCELNDDEREDQLDDGYEPDPPEYEMDPVEETLAPEEDNRYTPDLIPSDWVEGYDDNNASERGSHWEDD